MAQLEYIVTLRDKVSPQLQKINSQFDGLSGNLKKVSGSSTNMMNALQSSLGFIKGAGIVGAITAVAGGIYKIGSAAIDASVKMEKMKNQLDFATGNSSKSLQFVEVLANKYGVSFERAASGFTKLASSAKFTKLSLQQTKDIYESLTIAARGTNMSNEEFEGSILAVSQMMSKGKVSMEELRGQLGERLPGALGIAAKSMGVTTQQLEEMIKKGLSIEQFLPAFSKGLKATFQESARKSATGFEASMTRISNSFFKVKAQLGDKIIPVITPIIEFASSNFGVVSEELMKFVDVVIKNLTPAFNALSPILKLIGEMVFMTVGAFTNIWESMSELLIPVFEQLKPLLETVSAVLKWQFVIAIESIKKAAKIAAYLLKPVSELLVGALKGINLIYVYFVQTINKILNYFGAQGLQIKLPNAVKNKAELPKVLPDYMKNRYGKDKTKEKSIIPKSLGDNIGITSSTPKVVNINILTGDNASLVESIDVMNSIDKSGKFDSNQLKLEVEKALISILNDSSNLLSAY